MNGLADGAEVLNCFSFSGAFGLWAETNTRALAGVDPEGTFFERLIDEEVRDIIDGAHGNCPKKRNP